LMVGAGVPRLVVSKILNHVETGVTAVYDRTQLRSRKAGGAGLLGQAPRGDRRKQGRDERAAVRGRG
jgi:hypothetical protein